MFQKFQKFIIWYFNRTKTYSTLRFIIELTLISFPLKFIFLIPYGVFYLLAQTISPNALPSIESAQDFGLTRFQNIFISIIFPPIETVLGQWIPIWLTSLFTKKILIQIILSSLVFSALHLEPSVIPVVFPVAVIFAWSFILNKQKSLWRAFWVTTAIHFLHNLIAGTLLP